MLRELDKYLGEELTEPIFARYTGKMWALSLDEMPVSVVLRLPVRYEDTPYYFDVKFQMMPLNGYSKLFEEMLGHPNIEIKLLTSFHKGMEERHVYA